MIDIHSHVLFGIDDGSEDLDTSVELCRDAYENDCKGLVLTPHFFDFKRLERFVFERNEKIEILKEALLNEEIPLKLYGGSEVFLSDKVFSADNLDDLTINNTKYLLCEMPLGPFNTGHVTLWFDELIDRGYSPILAHPERYIEFHRDFRLIDELIERDVVFQVNIDSLTGKNGPNPQAMAIDMVSRGIAKLIASDAHDLTYRHTRLREKLDGIPMDITDEDIESCLIYNPQKILEGKSLF